MLKLTFLGTGTSQGVPMVACPCRVCRSGDPRDKRLRTSALVEIGDGEDRLNIVIDAGPDFRAQMLAAGVTRLDAILLTHEHKDHTGGLDDVRAFNYFQNRPVDIYATERVQTALRRDYAYVFEENPYPGAPEITLHTIEDEPFRVSQVEDRQPLANMPPELVATGRPKGMAGVNVKVVPVKGLHMRLPVTGFRIGEVAYLTDFNHIEDSELEKLKGVRMLVVNALGHRPHISHFNLEQAIEVARRVGPQRSYFTHISHRMGLYSEIQPTLPEGIFLAYDGLTIEV